MECGNPPILESMDAQTALLQFVVVLLWTSVRLVTSPAAEVRNVAMSVSVCLYVCVSISPVLSVRCHI